MGYVDTSCGLVRLVAGMVLWVFVVGVNSCVEKET